MPLRLDSREPNFAAAFAALVDARREADRIVRLGATELPLTVTSPWLRFGEGEEARTPETLHDILVRFADGSEHVLRSMWKPGDPLWVGRLDAREVAVVLDEIGATYVLHGHRHISDARHPAGCHFRLLAAPSFTPGLARVSPDAGSA